MGYNNLSDEDKLTEAINFVALGQPLPDALVEFLHEAGLYDCVVRSSEEQCQNSSAG